MSDDPERRIRDALHAAPLPPAPETLRNALESLPTSDIPAPRKRRIGPALLAVAAGMTLVVGPGRMLRILIATCVLRVPAAVAGSLRMRNCRPAIVEPGRVPLLLGFNLGPARDEATR